MKTKEELTQEILKYDINEIHEACNIIGHDVGWEYFEDELKTYSKRDMENLFEILEDGVILYDN